MPTHQLRDSNSRSLLELKSYSFLCTISIYTIWHELRVLYLFETSYVSRTNQSIML